MPDTDPDPDPDPGHVLHVELPAPTPPDATQDGAATSTSTATGPSQHAPTSTPSRIGSFLQLRRSLDLGPVHPEEGRLRVILYAVHTTMASLKAAPVQVSPEQRVQLRRAVLEHLERQLTDAFLDPADEVFLDRFAGRLVSAVLDGDYAGLAGDGGRRDTIRQVILDPQRLHEAVLLRPWGIGDLSDNGVEAAPPLLRGKKVAVHRGSALLVEGLLAAAYHAERLLDQSPTPRPLAHHVGVARQAAYTLESGLAGQPLLFDLDRLDRLAARSDASAQGHLAATRDLWTTQSRLAALGIAGPPNFLSSKARENANWHPTGGRPLRTDDPAPFVQLIGFVPAPATSDPPGAALPATATATATVAVQDPATPLPVLHSLMPEVRQQIDRQTGVVTLTSSTGLLPLVLSVPALASPSNAEQARRQDADLSILDIFTVAVLMDTAPMSRQLLPPRITLTDDQLLVGKRPVVERQPDGRWTFDASAVTLVREIHGTDGTMRPSDDPLSDWETPRAGRLRDTAAGARSDHLRLYVQLEDDEVMHAVGLALTRNHPDEVVWVQAEKNGPFRVLRGQSLLDNAPADARIKLIASGHGHTSLLTRERLLSGRTARGLAEELKALIPRLRAQPLPRMDRISLLGCALETPVVQRSFGREFAIAARDLGAADMETTVYGQTLVVDSHSSHLRKATQLHEGAPVRQGAAGTTWVFRSDPVTGVTTVRDKFPNGNEGVDLPVACCAILGEGGAPSTRSQALALADAWDRDRLRQRFREVVNLHRPPGAHLLPHLALRDDGLATMTYLRLNTGAVQTRDVVASADVRVLRAGMTAIREGFDNFRDGLLDPGTPAARMDLLNLGLMALMLSDLAGDVPGGDKYQEALWYMGLTQGGFQAGADAAAMAAVLRSATTREGAGSMATLVRTASMLSSGLSTVSRMAQAGSIAIDVARLVDALRREDRGAVSQAAVQVGLDAAGLVLVGLAAVADLAGAAMLAAAAEGLAVPLAGLSIGIAALAREVSNEIDRIEHNVDPLRQINLGYDEPLKRVSMDPAQPEHRALLVNGWAPMKRIDFVTNTVTFADATVGDSVLHKNQLYWQIGSNRLHDYWVNDDSDKQFSHSRNDKKLDLWTLMRHKGRAAIPQVTLPTPLRDPALVLGLMTAPNLALHFEAYSTSRIGGDFSLLHNALIERMQRNSAADFAADYVTSSSFAKSADHWHVDQKTTWLEVVLDDQPRTLALPVRSKTDTDSFLFMDDRPVAKRGFMPLDQSKVWIRLLGGGGAYTLAIPPDGMVRNPVYILPSGTVRETWTLMLKGGLINGGKPVVFLDRSVAGVRIAGQEIRFEALHDAVVQIADPLVPGVRLVLNMARQGASLVLTLPNWTESLRPGRAWSEAVNLLSPSSEAVLELMDATFRPQPSGQHQEPVQLSSALDSGELLSGLLDPATGASMLYGSKHLFLLESPRAGEPPPTWKRYELKGGEVSLDEQRRPTVRYDGGHHFGPISFTYSEEERRLVRDRLAMSGAGERALMGWLRDHPAWTSAELFRFMTDVLAAGVELAGPEGGPPKPVDEVDFYYRGAESNRPTEGTLWLALWARLDRLAQNAPGSSHVQVESDPHLAHDLVLAGLAGFRQYETVLGDAAQGVPGQQPLQAREIPAAEVARARQWLMLRHAQATNAYGHWSDLLPELQPLTLNERTRKAGLLQRLQQLLDKHLSASGGSSWIKLGDTPEASVTFAHELRDAGVDIRIDASDLSPTSRATDRWGPTDFYDVQVPSLRLFMHDLSDHLDRDAAVFKRLRQVRPVEPSDIPLQEALTRLADARDEARKLNRPVPPVPPRLLEQVRRAGLTFSRPPVIPPTPSIDSGSGSGAGVGAGALPTVWRPPATLGNVQLTPEGGTIDDATLRLWRDQAATQGLRLDAWYARHAVLDTPMEVSLREAAAEALRDRLIRLREHGDQSGVSALALHADATLNRQLFAVLQRLLPPAGVVKVAGRDTARPGDVLRFVDGQGAGHYALMRQVDTNLLHLPRDPGAMAGNPYWAYLGSVDDLGQDLRPRLSSEPDGPPVLDPGAYHAWSWNDKAPVLGGVYLYQNPFNGHEELFRLRRLDERRRAKAGAYGYFPTDGASNADWFYLGNTESLNEAELGELANRPSALAPEAFSLGLLEWWADRLIPGGSSYRNFRMEPDSFQATTWGGTLFRLRADGSLCVELDDNDATVFRLGDDPEFKALQRQFLAGREAPRWLLIQGNGRSVDLDGAAALGFPEVVILDEVDGSPRAIDLDDEATQGDEAFYEGRDLVIHRAGTGQLIRIRRALEPATDLPFDDEWTTSVKVTDRGGARRLAWPGMDRSLRLPMLTLYGALLDVARDGTDLRIGDADGWSQMRVPDVFAFENGVIGTTPTGDDEALLRLQRPDGRWQLARLSAPLVSAMATGASTPQRWRLVPGGDGRLGDLQPEHSTSLSPGEAEAPRQRWALASAKLSEAMASIVPAGQLDLSPRWAPATGVFPTNTPISGWDVSRREATLPT